MNGTSDNKIPTGYTSWLDFWERKSGEKANVCHRYLCDEKTGLVGAHVQLAEPNSGNEWYIVPLCRGCNNKIGDFSATPPLVPVNSNNKIKE